MNNNYGLINYKEGLITLNKPTNTLGTLNVKDKVYFEYLENNNTILKVDKDHSIYSESINTNDVQNNSITTDKIADNSITTNKIQDNAITTDKILDDAITTDKIANEVMLNNYSFNNQKINFVKIINDNMILNHENVSNFILDHESISVCNLYENQKIGNVVNIFNNTNNYITINSEHKMYNLFLLPPDGQYQLSISPNIMYSFIFFESKWSVRF
jgi:hypothetical protein